MDADGRRVDGVAVARDEERPYLARDGEEALCLYQEKAYDAVILDLIMPDMSGGETFDALKKIKPDVKVLLCSGYSINGQASEILDRGCDGFIQKPFTMKQLSSKISDVLKTRK